MLSSSLLQYPSASIRMGYMRNNNNACDCSILDSNLGSILQNRGTISFLASAEIKPVRQKLFNSSRFSNKFLTSQHLVILSTSLRTSRNPKTLVNCATAKPLDRQPYLNHPISPDLPRVLPRPWVSSSLSHTARIVASSPAIHQPPYVNALIGAKLGIAPVSATVDTLSRKGRGTYLLLQRLLVI